MPWGVLENDFQDMKHKSNNGNKLTLVVADRATGLLFAYPMPSKAAIRDALLSFSVLVTVRSNAWVEFTAQVVRHLGQ